MRIALIGTGKTGKEVKNLLSDNQIYAVFNRSNPVTVQALEGADIAIIFTPGDAVAELSAILLEAKLPAIWGSTGFDWPLGIDQQLRQAGLCWIHATNFSLGMIIMRRLLKLFGSFVGLLPNPECRLTETHHANKLDQPSGTALSWKKWLNYPVSIESIREGDIVGQHRLEMETTNDLVILEHRAKSRKIFAEGALWAAKQVCTNQFSSPGLHLFDEVAEKIIQEMPLCTD